MLASRAVSCRARLDNAAGTLRPGMFVRVRLIFESRDDALVIPEQAVVADPVQPFVFQVVEARRRRCRSARPAAPCRGRDHRRPEGRRCGGDRRASSKLRGAPGARCRPHRRRARRPGGARRCSDSGPVRLMKISELCIRRPVFASVLSLTVMLIGIVSYTRLPVREYPKIDEPVVTVDTTYRRRLFRDHRVG